MPGAGPYIAMHATPTARDFFLVNFYPSSLFTCIFPKPSRVFPVLDMASTGSSVGPQNKTGHPANCYRQLMQVPMFRSCGIKIGSKTCVIVSLGLHSEIVDII